MLLWGCQPDDALGFERYIESQEIPVIRVRMRPGTAEERVPEPEPAGATFPCGEAWEPEDELTCLRRAIQCERMTTQMAHASMERAHKAAHDWKWTAIYLFGIALILAVWR